jgi:hypothetical protein
MKHQITLDLPEEFIDQCQRDGATPEQVLRGFMADLCYLIDSKADPRDDGYSSNGSDERRLAWEYYERVGYPYFNPKNKR